MAGKVRPASGRRAILPKIDASQIKVGPLDAEGAKLRKMVEDRKKKKTQVDEKEEEQLKK